MKKVIIIDDEPLARQVVREYINAGYPELEVVAECDNGFEGVKAILKSRPDLIFLDVQMPRISGFEMLEVLEDPPDVIFATAFDEYAVQAFERNAIDYLLKPFSKERFTQAVNKWLSRRQHGDLPLDQLLNESGIAPEVSDRIIVRTGGDISVIPVSDLLYIEAFDDYVKIFTSDNWHLKKKTMAYYEKVLDRSRFFRIHRSFIINLQYLSRIEPMEKNSYVVVLKSGKRLPVSRGGYAKLRERLGV